MKLFIFLGIFTSSLGMAAEPAQYFFETLVRTIGITDIESQPAILYGKFSSDQNVITELDLRLDLKDEPEFQLNPYQWKPDFHKDRGLGWIESNASRVAVELDAIGGLDKNETIDTTLADLTSRLWITISFLCPHGLPKEAGQSVECSLGRVSGLEARDHDNPLRRSVMMDSISSVTIQRL